MFALEQFLIDRLTMEEPRYLTDEKKKEFAEKVDEIKGGNNGND